MSRPSYTQTAAPTVLPLTLDEARLQCKYDDHDMDDWFKTAIQDAVEYAQHYQWSQLLQSTWVMRLDRFPCGAIELHPNPVLSVTSVAYVDTAGATQTLVANTDYTVDIYAKPARILPAYTTSWPTTRGYINDVVVTFVAGYGTAASSVPGNIKQALLMLVEDSFEREVRKKEQDSTLSINGRLALNSFRVFY